MSGGENFASEYPKASLTLRVRVWWKRQRARL